MEKGIKWLMKAEHVIIEDHIRKATETDDKFQEILEWELEDTEDTK